MNSFTQGRSWLTRGSDGIDRPSGLSTRRSARSSAPSSPTVRHPAATTPVRPPFARETPHQRRTHHALMTGNVNFHVRLVRRDGPRNTRKCTGEKAGRDDFAPETHRRARKGRSSGRRAKRQARRQTRACPPDLGFSCRFVCFVSHLGALRASRPRLFPCASVCSVSG